MQKFFKEIWDWMPVITILLGVLIATLLANLLARRVLIITGGELILFSLGILFLKNRLGLLAKCLISLGVSIPFLSASLSAMFYPENPAWFVSWAFWRMFAGGLLPGLVVFFLGVWLYTEIDPQQRVRPYNVKWIARLENSFYLAMIALFVSVFLLESRPWIAGITIVCLILLSWGLVRAIPYRFRTGYRGSAQVMIALGFGGLMLHTLSWAIRWINLRSGIWMVGWILSAALIFVGLVMIGLHARRQRLKEAQIET